MALRDLAAGELVMRSTAVVVSYDLPRDNTRETLFGRGNGDAATAVEWYFTPSQRSKIIGLGPLLSELPSIKQQPPSKEEAQNTRRLPELFDALWSMQPGGANAPRARPLWPPEAEAAAVAADAKADADEPGAVVKKKSMTEEKKETKEEKKQKAEEDESTELVKGAGKGGWIVTPMTVRQIDAIWKTNRFTINPW